MIQVSKLSRFYGKTVGIKDLNFEINESEIFALLGPNGAGKTTTLRLLEGMISPSSGYVLVDGMRSNDINDVSNIHRIIGILSDVPGHYENISAYKNL